MVGAEPALTPGEMREIRALLLLKSQRGLGDRSIRRLVEAHGSGLRALRAEARQGDLLQGPPEEPPVAAWLREGFGILPLTGQGYPDSLSSLGDPPPVLFWKGRKELLSAPAVGIVGARRATGVGRRAAETMARILSEAGVTVVSGMALGIDGEAHRGALRGGGNTVAVLGSGLRVPYPASHRKLFREIGERGLLVSEFLPHESARPHHFPKRNRIIAALSLAVVVVEAGRRSGALITVDHGLDLGKDIIVIPGSVENPQAVGSNGLLKEGARVLADPSNILAELVELGHPVGGDGPGSDSCRRVDPARPLEFSALWEALSAEPLGVDEVARQAAVSSSEALAGLTALELGGWVRQCPGMRFQRFRGARVP